MLSLLVALSLSLTGAPAADCGTNGSNGAGDHRRWTPAGEASFDAEFHHVADGVVWLGVPIHVTRRDRSGSLSGTVKKPVSYPLACLSISDRRWIEEKNPTETCLISPKLRLPRRGAVGTLAPKSGFFRVKEIVNDETALIDYICVPKNNKNEKNEKKDKTKDVQGARIVWSFQLQSRIVAALNSGGQYGSISNNLVPDFNKMPGQEQEKHGVDFKLTKRVKNIDIVEDNR